MSFLQCPECKLTVSATAYYHLRGDQCPRCLTAMEPRERFRSAPVAPEVAASDPGVQPAGLNG